MTTPNTAVQNDLATRPAHSPGEWKSEVVGTNSGQWLVVYVDDPSWDGGKRELFESETVRTVFGNRNTLNPRFRDTKNAAEIRANVALALAAPDMLAALKALMDDLSKHAHGQPAPGHTKHIADGFAAIAKAEGR